MRTSPGTSDEAQVVEFGDVVLDGGGGVAQLGAAVLVVAGADGDERAVVDAVQDDDPEGRRQRLVGAPMRRQRRAHDARTGRADQLAGRQTVAGQIVRGIQ